MVAKETPEHYVAYQAALHLTHPALKNAAKMAYGNEQYCTEEFRLLNTAASYAALNFNHDNGQYWNRDLQNIYTLSTLLNHSGTTSFSTIFNCSTFKEKALFLETLDALNRDVADGVYKDPNTINNGSLPDTFRWFLFDGYALKVAKENEAKNTFLPTEELSSEQQLATVVVNALSEGAVVGAESGDGSMVGLVTWMVSLDWIEEKWGFTPQLIARAKNIAVHSSL